jgi:8-oxo-dGTP pyrophosphatase MutT (NUDIX family)
MARTFTRDLELRLKEKLPGQKAQNKMAPRGRIEHIPPLNTGKASVLILIFVNGGELWTLLIKRSEYPGLHSGQISFPGGKYDNADLSPVHTALREAREETGLETDDIRIIGTLTPLHIPVSNLDVLPVVGYLDSKPEFNICTREVEYLIQIPLKKLIGKNIVVTREIAVSDGKISVPGYLIQDEFVWGATAMILSEFIEVASRVYPVSQ